MSGTLDGYALLDLWYHVPQTVFLNLWQTLSDPYLLHFARKRHPKEKKLPENQLYHLKCRFAVTEKPIITVKTSDSHQNADQPGNFEEQYQTQTHRNKQRDCRLSLQPNIHPEGDRESTHKNLLFEPYVGPIRALSSHFGRKWVIFGLKRPSNRAKNVSSVL